MTPISFVLLVCFVFTVVRGLEHDWEDPTDIFGNSRSACGSEVANLKEDLVSCKDELDLLREEKGCKGPRVIKQRSVADYYVQRLINLMLASANFKNRKLGEGHEMRVNLDLYFNSDTLPVLQAFGSGDTNGHAWSELDTAFIKVFSGDPDFQGVFSESVGRGNADDEEYSFGFFDDRHYLTILISITGGFALCVIWVFMMGGTRSLKPAIFVGSVLLFSFCFAWTFWSESLDLRMQHMIEVSKTAVGELPEFCVNPSSGLFGWFLKASREQECVKFLKAKNMHHMANVDIALVFRKTLQVMFTWIPALSQSAGDAVKVFYGDSCFGCFTANIAKITMAPFVALVGLLALFVFLVTRSTFRFRTLLGEVSYGHQLQENGSQVQNPNQISAAAFQDAPALQSDSKVEQKKSKERTAWWLKSKKYKLKRSETLQPIRMRYVDPSAVLNPSERLQTRPLAPLSLALPGTIKRRAEEKAFRNLRRAFSTVERPEAADLKMT